MLPRNQNREIAAAKRGRDGGVKKRLGENAVGKDKRLIAGSLRAFPALVARDGTDARLRVGNRMQSDALAGRGFESRLRLQNARIFLQRSRQNLIERDCAGRRE